MMHHADTRGEGVARSGELHFGSGDDDATVVRRVDAREDLSERALAAPFSPHNA